MHEDNSGDGSLTSGDDYALRLVALQSVTWKERLRFLDPYGWHIRVVCKGDVLEVGSGIGRNLRALKGRSLGVDHNKYAVEYANSKGLKSQTVDAFFASNPPEAKFDTLLMAHLLEHIDESTQKVIFEKYLPYLRENGKIVLICPQEKGFNSDKTHIRWVDHATQVNLLESLGCTQIKTRSFPFSRKYGKIFIYNEFVAVGYL
jgi:SAM-dependent methyltransferase